MEANGSYRFQLEDRPLNVLVLLVQTGDRCLHDYVLPPWKQMEVTGSNWKTGRSTCWYCWCRRGIAACMTIVCRHGSKWKLQVPTGRPAAQRAGIAGADGGSRPA